MMTLEGMKRMKQERGFSMAQLSDYSGVPLGTLQKIFTGETANPRYATRQALEKALYGAQREKKQGEYTIEDYYTLPDVIIVCDKNKIKRWGIMGTPDFVLEVLSKSTKKKDCTKKLQKYADAGVREYWIIDPERRVLITYNFMSEDYPCIHPLEGTVGLALYDGELQIDLDEINNLIQEWPE